MKAFKPGRALGVVLLFGMLVGACGDEPTALNPQARGVPGTGGAGVVDNSAPPVFTPNVGPQPASPGTRTGPLVGADGQITVIAPPSTGENVPGMIFWVKDNNIYQGGAATTGAAPLTTRELGGKPLTKAAALALSKSPAISPDGSRLIYAYSPEPEGTAGNIIIGQDIYLIDLKSGTNSLLIKRDEPQTFLDNPVWSADAKYIYFDSRTPRRDQANNITGEVIALNRLELATSRRERLVEDAREPSPLPGNQQIVYVSVGASTGNYETNLKIYDIATRQSRTLLDPAQGFLSTYLPRVSPDGQTIVFSAAGGADSPGPTPTVKTGHLAPWLGMTGLLRAIPPPPLATPQAHGIPFDLWRVNPSGSELKRLTFLYEDQPMPAWSADGKKILFLAGQGLYMIDPDGKNLVKRSDRGGHGGFSWKSN